MPGHHSSPPIRPHTVTPLAHVDGAEITYPTVGPMTPELKASNERTADARGHMHRVNRLMPDKEARAISVRRRWLIWATVGIGGWPYVVPLIYVYEGGDRLFVHTGNHGGHFERNVVQNPRVCAEVSEMGPVHPGGCAPANRHWSTPA